MEVGQGGEKKQIVCLQKRMSIPLLYSYLIFLIQFFCELSWTFELPS